jgi:2-polyprenyl-3-methyl-5-hydroxy-6-metoxy-1,4-benzoquinol methylase
MNVTAWQRWSNENREYAVPHLRLRLIAKLINELRPAAYVDLGCAQGMLSTLTPGIQYAGVDFVLPQPKPGFEFYQCDFNTQPLPGVLANAELITCSGILEYIEDLPAFFGGIRAATRPDTRLIVSYFNMNHISRIAQLMRGSTFAVHPDWRNFLSPRDMHGVFSAAGFRSLRMVPVGLSIARSRSAKDAVEGKARTWPNFKGSYLFANHFVWVLAR